ncbi:MAG: hypothetical protein NWQ42_02745, partial [Alishewanella sp.]|nr:hypothetical protein [Alishewanella sp.]
THLFGGFFLSPPSLVFHYPCNRHFREYTTFSPPPLLSSSQYAQGMIITVLLGTMAFWDYMEKTVPKNKMARTRVRAIKTATR